MVSASARFIVVLQLGELVGRIRRRALVSASAAFVFIRRLGERVGRHRLLVLHRNLNADRSALFFVGIPAWWGSGAVVFLTKLSTPV